MKKQKIIILNITHGKNPYCKKRHFLPIAAGASRNEIINDASGEDNISEKNKWYGDFTSLYWAWKNLKDVDIIGTSHYRRYIADVDGLSNAWYQMRWWQFKCNKYDVFKFEKDLKSYDFIMIGTNMLDHTVAERYIIGYRQPENLEITTNALRKIHPDCVKIWQDYLSQNEFRYGYLFITKWDCFDKLMKWLYPVLLEIENNIDLTDTSKDHSRVIAFLYERLVPIFLIRYNYKIKDYGMYFINTQEFQSPITIKIKHSKLWQQLKQKFYAIKLKLQHLFSASKND